MRTYDRATYDEARRQWADFGPEWSGIRLAAGDRFSIYPPAGTDQDDRDDEAPSQRAIVYEAIKATPRALVRIVRQSASWAHVVRQLINQQDGLREAAARLDAEADRAEAAGAAPRGPHVSMADPDLALKLSIDWPTP